LHLGCNEARDVSHVHEKVGSLFVGDSAEAFIIKIPAFHRLVGDCNTEKKTARGCEREWVGAYLG
jgi:hypothetical protein